MAGRDGTRGCDRAGLAPAAGEASTAGRGGDAWQRGVWDAGFCVVLGNLGVDDRTAAVTTAMERGLLRLPPARR